MLINFLMLFFTMTHGKIYKSICLLINIITVLGTICYLLVYKLVNLLSFGIGFLLHRIFLGII